ncbi:hypothetical protein [Neorickettsia sp. 179522]|uniref:hypothetical protein n=1 Tax=Neorickettsia sp. 179522 TaxID=1714371 RepID=UPI00079C8B1F|nr:hypothetical protein [Neorickettsia sp. 179522]KYH12282.1 hypothetical protein AS219_00410 [Neorickettsia sp. 179522]
MFPADRNGVLISCLAAVVLLSIVAFYFSHKIISKKRKFKEQTNVPLVERASSTAQSEGEPNTQPSAPSNLVVQGCQPAFPISLLGKLSGCIISQEEIEASCNLGKKSSGKKRIVAEVVEEECSSQGGFKQDASTMVVRGVLQPGVSSGAFEQFFTDVFTTIATQGAFSGVTNGATLYIPFPIQPLGSVEVSDAYASAFANGLALASVSCSGSEELVCALALEEIRVCCVDPSVFQMLVRAFNNSPTVRRSGEYSP